MYTPRDALKLNVGFIIHETAGYSREFPFDFPEIHLHPDLDLRNLTGVARVTRTAQGLLLQMKLNAFSTVECGRCLKDFDQSLNIDFTELYAFTPNSITDSGLLVPETGKIDLEPLVREEMILAFPMSPICQSDCKGLCPICGNDLSESTCHHDDEEIEPHLSGLALLQ